MKIKQNTTLDSPSKQESIATVKRQWLRQSLLNIQNSIADQASIIQKSRVKTMKTEGFDRKCRQDEILGRYRNLDDLQAEEAVIRGKLRQINLLKKTHRSPALNATHSNSPPPQSRTQPHVSPHIKTNSQLKQLTKKYRQFKVNLQQKTRLIQQKQQEDKIKIRQLKEEQLRTLCADRRKKIEVSLAKIHLRRIKRVEGLRVQKMKLKEIRKQRLYEKLIRNYNKKCNQTQQKKLLHYTQHTKPQHVNLSGLSDHQKSYLQSLQQRQQKRTIRLAQSRLLPQINNYRSKFMDRVLDQEAKRKEQEKQRRERGRLIGQKHKQFQEKVREEFWPTSKERDQGDNKENIKVCALQWQQIKKKGNQYYKIGQKHAIPAQKRQQNEKNKIMQQNLANQSKTYPNYIPESLKHTKLARTQPQSPNTPKHLSEPKTYQKQLKKLKQLLKNPNINKNHKMEEIKGFLQQMSYSFVPNWQCTEDELMGRLSVKMELLEFLESIEG